MQIEENVNLEKDELVFTDGAVMNAALGGENVFSPEGRPLSSHVGEHVKVFETLAPDPYGTYDFSSEFADVVYSSSMIARRAVEILPEKAFSLLKSWESQETKNNKDVNRLMQVWRKKLLNEFIEAGQMGRKYQDAYVVLFFNDSLDLSLPLDTSKATKLVGAAARGKWSVNPVQGYPGSSEYYTMTNNYYDGDPLVNDASLRNVHRSRIVHVPGLLVDNEQRRHRQGYNMSVFSYLVEPLSKWICSNHAGIDMLQSHSAFTLGLAGLAWRTSNKDVMGLKKRFASILSGLRQARGLFYDKDSEDANFISRSYSGVDSLIEQLEKYLINASDLPPEYLLQSGESAYSDKGMGSRYAFASLVESYQRTHVTPIVDALFPVLAEVYDTTLGDDLDFFEPEYGSALIHTRSEEADIRFKHAQADSIYLNAATQDDEVVVNSETVRTRWESGHYSDDLTLRGDFKKPKPPAENARGSEEKEELGEKIAKKSVQSSKASYTKMDT